MIPACVPTVSPIARDIAKPGYIRPFTNTLCGMSPSKRLTTPPTTHDRMHIQIAYTDMDMDIDMLWICCGYDRYGYDRYGYGYGYGY